MFAKQPLKSSSRQLEIQRSVAHHQVLMCLYHTCRITSLTSLELVRVTLTDTELDAYSACCNAPNLRGLCLQSVKIDEVWIQLLATSVACLTQLLVGDCVLVATSN